MDGLKKAREEIDQIDREMARLFERRMRAAEDVIAYKQQNGLPILDSGREKQVLEKGLSRIEDPACRPYYADFLRGLMGLSKEYQLSLSGRDKVAYPGVEGAYSHIAARKLFPHRRLVSYPTFPDVVRAVDAEEVPVGVIPFENSYTGEVGQSLDLLYQYDVRIIRMYDLPVSHNLLGVPGTKLSDVRQVYSHEQGLSQCREFLDTLNVEGIPYTNTALAAKLVSEQGDPAKAAIASYETAELYRLEVLVRDINTSAENTTRFAVLSKEPLSQGERFSLLFTVNHNAGQLAGVMEVIARHGFNMESIRSRSVRNVPWQYYFYVEIIGDLLSEEAQRMLSEMRPLCAELKALGSYSKSAAKER